MSITLQVCEPCSRCGHGKLDHTYYDIVCADGKRRDMLGSCNALTRPNAMCLCHDYIEDSYDVYLDLR